MKEPGVAVLQCTFLPLSIACLNAARQTRPCRPRLPLFQMQCSVVLILRSLVRVKHRGASVGGLLLHTMVAYARLGHRTSARGISPQQAAGSRIGARIWPANIGIPRRQFKCDFTHDRHDRAHSSLGARPAVSQKYRIIYYCNSWSTVLDTSIKAIIIAVGCAARRRSQLHGCMHCDPGWWSSDRPITGAIADLRR